MSIGLTTRISIAGGIIGLLLVLGLGGASFWTTHQLVQLQLSDSLNGTALRLADRLAEKLNGTLEQQAQLAANTLFGNALVDDLGRDRYLPGFLADLQQVEGIRMEIFVTNFLGRTVASNGVVDAPQVSEQQIRQAVEQNRFVAKVIGWHAGQPKLVLIRPIIFANTGLAEGALIYQFPLHLLMRDHDVESSWHDSLMIRGAELRLRIGDAAPIIVSGEPGIVAGSLTQTLDVPLQAGEHQLLAQVRVGGNPEPFEEARQGLMRNYLQLGLITLILTLLVSRALAHYITRSLRRLQADAEAIVAAESFTRRMPSDGGGEVAQLAGAFNGVLDRLEQAYFRLEQQSREALEQRDQKYRAVVEQAGEALLLFDRERQIIEANPSACRLLSLSAEQLIGDSLERFLPPLDQRLLDDARPSDEVFEVELSRLDGTRVPVEISSGEVDIDGQMHCLWFLRDISERRVAQAALEEKRKQLEELAFHDNLTGLPNRHMLADRMQQAMAYSQRNQRILALCYLDLDGFKAVNDQAGHEAGDQVLVAVSQRLSQVVRNSDTVARLGGDEFVLLLGNLRSVEECGETLRRVLTTLARPHRINNVDYLVSASIGVTIYPDDHEDADTLLRHADQVMYLAKQQGRNRFQFFDLEAD